jgi:hypothetical protein
MASGRLGKADLAAATNTQLYEVPASTVATADVRFTNRNGSVALVRLAITSGGAPAASDWIEYDSRLEANGVIVNDKLVLSAGEKIYAYASTANVSVRVHGFEEVA